MINRVKEIKSKGFSFVPEKTEISNNSTVDFNKVKIGVKTLEDAILNLGSLKRVNPICADKNTVLEAINKNDQKQMREISNFFFKTSGIYSRLCKYMAYLYRYDWILTPYTYTDKEKDYARIKDTFNKALLYVDNFNVKKNFGEIALKVIKEGCFYGYLIDQGETAVIQELSPAYCRSRFKVGNMPVVEFNMKFFNDYFRDVEQRMRMLKVFPPEFQKGYELFLDGKLPPAFKGDTAGWYMLDPESAFKFNLNGEDQPLFISVIPAILDLDAAQELDRKKMAQKLLKIIIQKMPLDKNGDLIFDIDEAAELHNNAVRMLSKAVGVDVLTTFADVEVADMADKNSVTSIDELNKVERTVYNESGTAQNLFNADGNIAMDKSISNDEAAMYNLLLQFETLLNLMVSKKFNTNPKKVIYRVQLLNTTIYNYKDLAKQYKELTQLGYSKMLPEIALGQSQSSILAAAFFENQVLDLVNVFIPPMSSNTMSASALKTTTKINTDGDNEVGRKEKPDDQKSDKTIKNRESMN